MVLFGKRKDPFDPTGLEGLSITEQEKVLTRVGTREAELLKKPEVKSPRIKAEAEKRIKELERQKGFSRIRQRLIEEEKLRKRTPRKSFREALASAQGIASTTGSKGLSPFQKNILKRERILALIKRTPPMDRPRVLRAADPFKQALNRIRGVEETKTQTGLISFENSKAQQAQLRLREKLNSAKGGI